jgi:peptidoglycan LD-endopeptidase CwlK
MRDLISIERVEKLHPKIRSEVKSLIEKAEAGFPATIAIRVVQGYRTLAEQDALYAQGRTKPGPIVTNSRGGSSYHNYGLAIDFAILYDKDGNGKYETLSWDLLKDFDRDGVADWQEVVKTFKASGYTWGGDWNSIKDNPHLQKDFGKSVKQLLTLIKNGNKDSAGYVTI